MEQAGPEITNDEVNRQLQRLRSSPLFSHSRRYPIFLEYVVRRTLEGGAEELKERTVGVEAFGRSLDYDLNADPVVRVTAGEVRKRLAQYYYEPAHQEELRIELRPGSYVPEFRFVGSATLGTEIARVKPEGTLGSEAIVIEEPVVVSAVAPPNFKSRQGALHVWRSVAIVLAFLLLVLTTAYLASRYRRSSDLEAFWSPVVEASGPVTICVGSVVAMVNNNAVAPPPSTVSGHPLSVDPIAVSDASTFASIQQILSMRSKTTALSSSTGISFSDLQKGPIVLISGFNNQWTMRITEGLRFHFVRLSQDEYAIEERSQPRRQWSINTATPFVKMTSDYAIIGRFHDTTTDQIAVVAAGIGENGTLAAGRALTDERFFDELKRMNAFPGPSQNFEAVIETQIIDGKPGPPRIIATSLW